MKLTKKFKTGLVLLVAACMTISSYAQVPKIELTQYEEYVESNYSELTKYEKEDMIKEFINNSDMGVTFINNTSDLEQLNLDEIYDAYTSRLLNAYNYYLTELGQDKQDALGEDPQYDEAIRFLIVNKDVEDEILRDNIEEFISVHIDKVTDQGVIDLYISIYGQEAYDMFSVKVSEMPDSPQERTNTRFSSYSPIYAVSYAHNYNGEEYNDCMSHGTSCPEGYNMDFKYYLGEDCANFVSQCLDFGNMPSDSIWKNTSGFNASVAWRGCDQLLDYFYGKGASKYTYSVSSLKNNMSTFYNDAYKGDIFFLLDSSGDAWHAMIVTGYGSGSDLLYSAHTSNRNDKSVKKMLSEITNITKNNKIVLLSF